MNFSLHKSAVAIRQGVSLLLVAAMALSMGCASVSKFVDKTKQIDLPFTSDQPDLKKKIAVAPIGDMTGTCESRFLREFSSRLVESLARKCPDGVFIMPDQSGKILFLDALSRDASEVIDGVVLAQKARQAGVNTVVVLKVGGISKDRRKKGIVGFRKLGDTLRIWCKAEVYDANTGAKLLFENVSTTVDLNEGEGAVDAENLSTSMAVMEALGPFSKDISKRICTAVKSQPWSGFVVAVEGDTAVISSGLDAGIREGDVFALFSAGRMIDNGLKQRFMMPGIKIDEIRIFSVEQDQSRGKTVSGKDVPENAQIQVISD